MVKRVNNLKNLKGTNPIHRNKIMKVRQKSRIIQMMSKNNKKDNKKVL